MTQVSNALILALGPVAYSIAEAYQEQLRVRHPKQTIPTVEILALLGEGQAEGMSLPALIIEPRQEPDLVNILSSLYPKYTKQSSNRQKLLEELYSDSPRLLGQISLHQHIHAIEQQLQDISQRIASVETTATLTRQKMRLADPNQTHVFVLLSLADSFMTGLMPDLAYVIQHSLRAGAPHDTFIQVHLVLMLPGFDGEISLDKDNVQQRAEDERRVKAWAAACLKEIDYYFVQGYSYYHRFNSLTITNHYSPLGSGQIYLIEPTNEKQHRLNDVTSLATMVSNWLYHVTMTPLHDLLYPSEASDKKYSSFGNASLSIPIATWIERSSVELQLRLLNNLLRGNENEESQVDITTERARLHLTEQDIRQKLTDATGYHELRMRAGIALRVPLTESDAFLNQIQKRYSKIVHEKLPEVRENIFQQARLQMIGQNEKQNGKIMSDLEHYIWQLIDEPKGGLTRTAAFLTGLYNVLQQEKEKLTREKKKFEKSKGRGLSTIKSRRKEYSYRAQVASGLGSVPFIKILPLMLIGAFPILLLSWRFYQNDAPSGALAILVICALLGLWVLFRTFQSLQTARNKVIKGYEQRLRTLRDAELRAATLKLYDKIVRWIEEVRRDVRELPQTLVKIRAQLLKRQKVKQLDNINRLCGLAAGTVSESLLTPDSIKQFEKESGMKSLQGEMAAMHQQLDTPAQWIKKKEDDQQTIGSRLSNFSHQQVSQRLRQYDIDKLFKLIDPPELEAKFYRMIQISHPYWQHNSGQARPYQVVALANPDNHRELLQKLLRGVPTLTIEDKYELVIASVRHGLSLAQTNNFTQILARQYDIVLRKEPDTLHTTSDRRLLLTDQQQTPGSSLTQISVRNLCAVAFGLHVMFKEDDGIYWANSAGEERKVADTWNDTIRHLEQNPSLQDEIRQTTLQTYNPPQSLKGLQSLIAKIDFNNPLYPIWIILAIQDFLRYESQS